MGTASNYLEFSPTNTRRGRECRVRAVVRDSPLSVRKARENSLAVKGAKMFNLLPAEVRNHTSDKTDSFKKKLDRFLSDVPDQPTDSEDGRAAETNSLLHQIPLQRQRS